MKLRLWAACLVLAAVIALPSFAHAAGDCSDLPKQDALKTALIDARKQSNGGINLDMWATLVDRHGIVCAIAFTGQNEDDQWPGSRIISAQKANTANAFSVRTLALSTANLYSAVQPGGPLFGLQDSNPVNTDAAYLGAPAKYGTNQDPMMGKLIGGINVFGGGLPLYTQNGGIIGGLGVSGDSSCADHNIAWRVRNSLGLDYVPLGVSPAKNDQIIYDIANGKSPSGFGHPVCGGKEADIAATLPASRAPLAAATPSP